jgi:predicted nucleotidyltransferase component of viral defense system
VNIGDRVHSLEKILVQIIKNKLLPQESYLAGGTAIYFYLRHRLSVDLDFFTPKAFNPEALVFKMRNSIKEVDLELMEKETLILFLSSEKLKFSLFHLPYQLLSPLSPYEVKSGIICPLASLDDIEAMKAIALAQRGSAKDFIDLYDLLRRTGHSFKDLSFRVRIKYRVDEKYDYHLKTATVYFDDAERELDAIWLVDETGGVRNISNQEWKDIKDFFVRFCR